jgi:hypothetical protein
MLSFKINHEANGAALNDAFLLILPKHPDHAPGTPAEIFDNHGHHILGFATIKARSSILFSQISDTLALCFMGKPAPEVKQHLATQYSLDNNMPVDILAIEWTERNVDACVALQAIQYEKILNANKQPSPALLSKLTAAIVSLALTLFLFSCSAPKYGCNNDPINFFKVHPRK